MSEFSQSTQQPGRIMYNIKEFCAEMHCGITKAYELLASGAFDVRRCGGRTLITAESVRRYLENLPRVQLTTGASKKTAA